ncbi:hypothetical protein [Streptomyces sp. BK79]|uniref:hypothetical protein n=1 Tax=Streptomyces sp. BK79 TaxID=3350097 RepID=UPI0037706E65
MSAGHGEGDGGPAVTRPALHGTPGTERLLAAALRDERVDAEGERRAVAAYLAARDAAPARAARARRRDDWRPRERRSAGRPLRTALSVLLASLTLGGVTYAAIGGGGAAPDSARPDRARPSATADGTTDGTADGTADGIAVRPLPTPRPASTSLGVPARPDGAADADRDTVAARCRAYERLVGRGRVVDATAWQRLVADAGGEEKVAAHCAGQRRTGPAGPSGAAGPAVPAGPDGPAAPADPSVPAVPAAPGRPDGSAGGPGEGNGDADGTGGGNSGAASEGDGGDARRADGGPGTDK